MCAMWPSPSRFWFFAFHVFEFAVNEQNFVATVYGFVFVDNQ